MFSDSLHNEVHYEWLSGRGVVCQQRGRYWPFWEEDIEKVTCPECLDIYPRLWWDKNRNPHIDSQETQQEYDADDIDDLEIWHWYLRQTLY